MGRTQGRRPTSLPLGTARLVERILKAGGRAALDHRLPQGQELSHRGQSQGVHPQEGRQTRTREGSLKHVEVSQLGCVAAPIIEEPRPPHPPQRRTHRLRTSIGPAYHTLKHEKPVNESR